LHAHTQIPAHRRDQLERLLRYPARGAVSLERLQQAAHGDLVSTFTHPGSDGTTGLRLSPVELLEKLAALVPLPRVHLGRSGGGRAPHSALRAAIRPPPRQQGVDGADTPPGTPYGHWARLLSRVLDLAMATCPFCRRGSRRVIAAITQASVITRLLRHLQLASIPPPLAPARWRQALFAFDYAHDIARGLVVGNVRIAAGYCTPVSLCHPVSNPPSPALHPRSFQGPRSGDSPRPSPREHIQAALSGTAPDGGLPRCAEVVAVAIAASQGWPLAQACDQGRGRENAV
jgi:Putative transposase